MRNWDNRDESGTDAGCEWEKDRQDVQLVCKKPDLPRELVFCSCGLFFCRFSREEFPSFLD